MGEREFFRLRCFVTLTEVGSFSNAAESLFISQSSLSKHIIRLEEELGVVLFDRHGRVNHLTDVGSELLTSAKTLLASYDEMRKTASAHTSSAGKTLRVGIPPLGIQLVLIGLLEKIINKTLGRNVIFIERDEPELIQDASRNAFDLLIVRREIFPSKGFRTYPIFRERAVVIMRADHRLANRESLNLSELSKETFILMDENSAPYKFFGDACRAAGFEPNIARTSRTESVTFQFLCLGRGITLSFETDAEMFRCIPDLRFLPLEDDIVSDIVLAVPTAKKVSAFEKRLVEGIAERYPIWAAHRSNVTCINNQQATEKN